MRNKNIFLKKEIFRGTETSIFYSKNKIEGYECGPTHLYRNYVIGITYQLNGLYHGVSFYVKNDNSVSSKSYNFKETTNGYIIASGKTSFVLNREELFR